MTKNISTLDDSKAVTSFSIKDTEESKYFYHDKLGLDVTEEENGKIRLNIGNDEMVLLYKKPNHSPATFSVLNLPVRDIDKAVQEMSDKGISFEHYPGTDEKGIYHGDGPLIAWFKDPSGNILSLLQE